MKLKKSLLILSVIGAVFYVYVSCTEATKLKDDPRGPAYSGSASCQNCHQTIFDSYRSNEHFHTSWPVRKFPENIHINTDSFIYNEHSKVVIEHREDGIYQVAYVDGTETVAGKFELGLGSGEKAYTFGYWQDKKINQLPLSYFTTINQWTNSPGFPAHAAYFDRPIIRRCMECHTSYIGAALKQTESLSNVRNMDSASLIYGIDCERCHGPGADHVKFQTENPAHKTSRYISSWQSLSRRQRLDACGVCHSGNDQATQFTLFRFKPGDTLANFLYPEMGETVSNPDVHGKQVQLLSTSKCFTQSNNLECSSCHSLHKEKKSDLHSYTQTCQKCHQEIKHRSELLQKTNVQMIINKCIDCHMPREVSNIIRFREKGQQVLTEYILRTHRIAIYPEITKAILNEK